MEPVNKLDSDDVLDRLGFLVVPESQLLGVVQDENPSTQLAQIAGDSETQGCFTLAGLVLQEFPVTGTEVCADLES